MVVAMVASEMEPWGKTGGLGDVLGSLPFALAKRGVKIHIFLPKYGGIRENRPQLRLKDDVTLHLLSHPAHFNRIGLYGDRTGDYPDNLERFSWFCREALETMRAKKIAPDVLHAHDWQAALAVVYLKGKYRSDPLFSRTASLQTIHNLAYQGLFPAGEFPALGLPPEFFGIQGLEFYGKLNALKGGLMFADAVSTVSPTYAREIQQPEYGAGLDGVLRFRSNRLVGILNGLDGEKWSPASDDAIDKRFDANKIAGKASDKAALQQELGLPVSAKKFLAGMVTRLASQKGLDLVIGALPRLDKLGIQLAILGSGERPIEEALKAAVRKYPWVRVRFAFDEGFGRKIYAGSDGFLMPSLYEPCGLGQMIAMRYGSVPVVRRTGGLVDTVTDVDADPKKGRGFSFGPVSSEALAEAVKRAVDLYGRPKPWAELRKRCMAADFSWDASARDYLRLYNRLTEKR